MTVKFLAHTRDKFALRSKLSKLRRRPSPEVLCEVVQCCLRLDEVEKAFEHAEQGAERYPDSEIIGEMLRIARRERAKHAVRWAQKELKVRPSPEIFVRLASDAFEIHEMGLAIQSLRECIQRFPSFARAHSELARILEKRYLRDLAALDGKEVVRLLRRSTRIDPTDLLAALRLARFMMAIGRYQEAKHLASLVLAKDGRVEPARQLLETLTHVEDSEDPDLDELLVSIEEQGRLPTDSSDHRRMQREVNRLVHHLPQIREQVRARRAVVVDVEGNAYDESGALSNDALVSMARSLAHTAHLTARRGGLGPLRGATLESSTGSLVFRRGLRCTTACLLPRTESVRGAQSVLARWVAGGAARTKQGES